MSTRKEVKEVHIQLSQDNLQIQFLYEEDRLKEFVQIKSTLFFGSSLKPFIYIKKQMMIYSIIIEKFGPEARREVGKAKHWQCAVFKI